MLWVRIQPEAAQLVECSVKSVECCGFESHSRQLIFLWKSDCLGCAVLLYFVCLTLLASLFLPSVSLINMYMYMYIHVCMYIYIHVYTYIYIHVYTCRSGLVESKIRILISKLEYNEGIELAHVYPTSYGPPPGDK